MATMATDMTSTLSVPSAEDTMEISSNHGNTDQDIDIDFMDPEHVDNDVDWMLQDATSERGTEQADAAQNDDLMYDDGDEIAYVDEEDTMQEDAPVQPAEHHDETVDLDAEYDPHPATEETLYDVDVELQQAYEQPEEETLVDFEPFDEHPDEHAEDVQPLDDDDSAEAEAPAEDEIVRSEEVQIAQPTEQSQTGNSDHEDILLAATVTEETQAEIKEHEQDSETQPSAVDATSHDDASAPTSGVKATDSPQQDWSLLQFDEPAAEAEIEEEVSTADTPTKQSSTSTLTHPITVAWIPPTSEVETSKLEFSLFRHSEQDDPNTYFLQDPTVASSTLTDLFRSCRSVLDEELSDELELELYVHGLDLTICEDSAQCHSSSLAQIVDVYLTLSHNDGIEDVPALYMELYTTTRLSAQLTSLFKAASEKTGLSQLKSIEPEPETPEEAEENLNDRANEQENRDPSVAEEEQEPEWDIDNEKPLVAHDTKYADAQAVDEETMIGNNKHVAEQVSAGEGSRRINEQEEHPQETYEENTAEVDIGDIGQANQAQEELAEAAAKHQEQPVYEQEHQTEQANENEGAVEEDQSEFDADVAEGGGASSGSSTVQGENQAETTRGYSPPATDESKWLIEYDYEDNDFDAFSETAHALEGARQPGADGEQAEAHAHDAHHGIENDGTEETFDSGEQPAAESYDDETFNVDDYNQEFDFDAELENHEGWQEDEQDVPEQSNNQDHFTFEDIEHGPDTTQTQETGTGTFQVPSSNGDDEDEITFDDEEFTADDVDTQDAAVEAPTTGSPLGKRSRDDEDDGAIDGGDQESKRLKAA